MKEKFKTNKGITLIALIITIIVLLILATVSIKLVWDGKIIDHANNAVTAYKTTETNELEQLNILDDQMKQYGGTKTETTLPDKWWELTEKENKIISFDERYSGFNIALNDNFECRIVSMNNNEKDVIIIDGIDGQRGSYAFPISQNAKEYIEGNSGESIELYKWYFATDCSMFTDAKEYTGKSPISLSNFENETIISQSYLERIIASFNN